MSERHGLPEGYRIRTAKAADVERACEIAKEAWEPIQASFREILGPAMHDALSANWREDKADQIRGHAARHPDWMLVVERESDDRVMAFLTYRLDAEKTLGTIGNNAVAREAQGKGIGPAIYRHALEVFRRAGMKFANVTTGLDPGHAPARRAYEKAGFDIARQDVTYYKTL